MKLTYDPSNPQKEVMRYWADQETEEILAGGSKGGGKSDLGIVCSFHDALVYPDTHYFIARDTLSDLRKYTIPSIHEVFSRWDKDNKERYGKGLSIEKYAPYNGQDNYFRCYNQSRVYLLECTYLPSDPLFERFGSMQMTKGWIEEGGEVAEKAKTNLALSIGRKNNDKYNLKGKLLITCNPKKNWMKTQFIDPFVAGTLPKNKKVVLFNVYDNKHRQRGYEFKLEALTGVERERLLEGNWNYEDDALSLIRSEKINDMYLNIHVQKTGQKFITCDVARYGKDKTVIFVWDGLVLIDVIVLLKNSVPEAVNAIQFLMIKHGVPVSNVCADDDGVGGGVTDYLACRGFVNNSRPLPTGKFDEQGKEIVENFDNLKSQCAFKLADYVNKGHVLIEVDMESLFYGDKSVKETLNEELEWIKHKSVDDDRKRAIMPKDEIKKKLGRSPDYSDAFIQRMHFELLPELPVLVW